MAPSILHSSPTNVCIYVKVCGLKQLGCHAGPKRGEQVSPQRGNCGIGCTQVTQHTSKGIHPGFETQGRRHQKSKTGVDLLVAPQKRTDVFKIFFLKLHQIDMMYMIFLRTR